MESRVVDRIEELLYDEQKIVTYKLLSREFNLPVNTSKNILLKFFNQHKSTKENLNAIYCVTGLQKVNGIEVQKIFIIPEENLEILKKDVEIRSTHIYSIQQCKLKDSSSLYITDLAEDLNSVCTITCKKKEIYDAGQPSFQSESVSEGEKQPTKSAKLQKENLNAKCISKTKENIDTSNKPKNNNIASLFQNKLTSKSTEKNKVSEPVAVTSDSNKVIAVKEEEIQVKKIKTESKKGTNKQRPSNKADNSKKTSGKRKQNSEEFTPQEKKSRKRIQVFADDSSDSDDENEEIIEDAAVKEEEEEEDPIPSPVKIHVFDEKSENISSSPSTGTALQQKIVSKTFVDENGYLVTKKIAEMVEEPETLPHEEKQAKETSPQNKNTTEVPNRRTNKLSLSLKSKKNAQQKQSSLMSFFKKT